MCLGRLPVALLGPDLSHEEIGLGGLRREGLRGARCLVRVVRTPHREEHPAALEVENRGLVERLGHRLEEGQRLPGPTHPRVRLGEVELHRGVSGHLLAQLLELYHRELGPVAEQVRAPEEHPRRPVVGGALDDGHEQGARVCGLVRPQVVAGEREDDARRARARLDRLEDLDSRRQLSLARRGGGEPELDVAVVRLSGLGLVVDLLCLGELAAAQMEGAETDQALHVLGILLHRGAVGLFRRYQLAEPLQGLRAEGRGLARHAPSGLGDTVQHRERFLDLALAEASRRADVERGSVLGLAREDEIGLLVRLREVPRLHGRPSQVDRDRELVRRCLLGPAQLADGVPVPGLRHVGASQRVKGGDIVLVDLERVPQLDDRFVRLAALEEGLRARDGLLLLHLGALRTAREGSDARYQGEQNEETKARAAGADHE